MVEKIGREQFSKNDEIILNSRYRLRLFPTADVPILKNLSSVVGSELIVIDLPKAEGLEQRFFESAKSGQLMKTVKINEQNKENILPAGCTLGGDPLQVSFLTIEKLEKTTGAGKRVLSNVDVDIENVDEDYPFKAHLMTSLEAVDLMHDLKNNVFDTSLSNLTRVVLADASGCQNLLIIGRQLVDKQIMSFKALYLGNLAGATAQLNTMTSQLQVLPMRHCICRCRFDVLPDAHFFHRSPGYCPASFGIQAEWNVVVPKTKINLRKVIPFENFLAMPPDNAKVTVKFKPGWMDHRVLLTDNIFELKQLMDMAMSLKAGKIPWTEQDADTISASDGDNDAKTTNEPAFLLQRVTELIERARNRPDIESVYPFDFTDRLWDVIRHVNSTEMLKNAFELIYAELRTGEFRVMVETDKESSLAKMLRVRTLSNMVFQRLEPITCLEMLVEIGVDRFRSDIQHRFIKSEFISNVAELEPYFRSANVPIEERIEKLMPLYLALQSMLMIAKFVRLTPHKKMLMTKRLLGHFTTMSNTDTTSKEFSFDAYMEDIYRDSLKRSMTEWLIERIYEKPIQRSNATPNPLSRFGLIHEIAFLCKNVGFAHVTSVDYDSSSPTNPTMQQFGCGKKSAANIAAGRTLSASVHVKSEVLSQANTPTHTTTVTSAWDSDATAPADPLDRVDGEEEDEDVPAIDQLFNCVYITATSTSLAELI